MLVRGMRAGCVIDLVQATLSCLSFSAMSRQEYRMVVAPSLGKRYVDSVVVDVLSSLIASCSP